MLAVARLNNFRNYEDYTIHFSPGLNLILGENGVGKTNLLEAVFLLLEGKSIKGAEAQEMIRKGFDECKVEGKAHGEMWEEGNVLLRRGEETRKKRFKSIGAVAFVPDDIYLIKGNPEWRRRFVDETLKAIKPSYGELMREYNRVLKQRNHALREGKGELRATSGMESWDLLLVKHGTEIVRERRDVLHVLSRILNEEMIEWGMGGVDIKYYSSFSVDDEEGNLEKMRKMREAEMKKGVTLSGPHRDEILFYLDGRNLRREGSQGEQKMFCLACKLAQARMIEELTPRKVVLILDDCFSELDFRNRKRLAESFKQREQVIVTSTEEIRELVADMVVELRRGKKHLEGRRE